MPRLSIVAALFGLLQGAALAQAAPGVEGVWKSAPNERGRYVEVEIAPCAAALCGVIVGTNSPTPEKVMGRAMIRDMAGDGPGRWRGGTIWAPDDDETYDASMELLGPGRLRVSGCIPFGLMCRAQIWTRVE
ncbi:hypothetical protein LNKW23_01610 [Paralimibaculum aggregatum]|uniref:DUF2147 domain-containing protein n=1 Tax=Paralimibaculum aggregatum TaxID=3036245 RepID=A0ABQ6LFY6_9RHOB|nr:DUF2147 domain-containing protein [Limibaculum sp. NKW23]GMG80949.1 hypothetical protein LNKW23_01610 [Limibaculum sp. NKW23]